MTSSTERDLSPEALDQVLDAALDATFPASDPVADLVSPTRKPRRGSSHRQRLAPTAVEPPPAPVG